MVSRSLQHSRQCHESNLSSCVVHVGPWLRPNGKLMSALGMFFVCTLSSTIITASCVVVSYHYLISMVENLIVFHHVEGAISKRQVWNIKYQMVNSKSLAIFRDGRPVGRSSRESAIKTWLYFTFLVIFQNCSLSIRGSIFRRHATKTFFKIKLRDFVRRRLGADEHVQCRGESEIKTFCWRYEINVSVLLRIAKTAGWTK
jgi:hypothetical protein